MALTTLLTISDFSNPYTIFEKHQNNDGYEKYFDDILAKSQKEWLVKIIGWRMYTSMLTAYPDGGFYDNLVSGVDYTVNSVTYDFEGIKPALMRYSYYMWHRFNADQLIATGSIIQGLNENKKVIPVDTMVKAYNEMTEKVFNSESYSPNIHHYIDNEYTGTDWTYLGFKKINSWDI